uniref:F-BAR and double SH3 domains protein 2-like n=1 Tax=Maylandia zebra TaxID=106582 RepID=UPI000D319D0E|nr:F-BAR and double SH3 domains protein 2-like [Maylandia zebra]
MQVLQEFHQQLFVQKNMAFQQAPDFMFQPVDSDTASQPDELTIEEQEILEVIDDGDMEDWVKARNRSGQVGYVPEKYLQLPSSNSLLSMLQSLAALDARSHPPATPPNLKPNSQPAPFIRKGFVRLRGQTEDELSFPEGAIIPILSRETHENDGFWEGEFNGVVGVFVDLSPLFKVWFVFDAERDKDC